MRELALVLALQAFAFFRFVFIVGLYCLVSKFVLGFALKKYAEKNDLGYFEECHRVGVVVLCRVSGLVVVQGGEYVRGESRFYHHFRFPSGPCRLFLRL